MEKNFKTYHKTFMGMDAPTPTMGYPDMGSRFYAK